MCPTKQTKLKQETSPEDKFRRGIGKLDNWIYHKRIDEYLKEEKPLKEVGPDGQA